MKQCVPKSFFSKQIGKQGVPILFGKIEDKYLAMEKYNPICKRRRKQDLRRILKAITQQTKKETLDAWLQTLDFFGYNPILEEPTFDVACMHQFVIVGMGEKDIDQGDDLVFIR